ncbi:ThiF family adenylyltransferase [Cellulomonas citrea]|uniref:ThiF family adenylyltransferase n=1 Tax=Cellulomonas citrea TaxID=1909423 RepID=UPI0013582888|nr:ThiF family adenylyltransferase [Cellulomonas citrea]
MTAWDEAIKSSVFEFTEELERRGFRADERTLTGAVGAGVDAVRVEIALPDSFPFAPPVVSPPASFPRSWHRERDGAMCLYPLDHRQKLPWLDVDDFLALVERWIVESTAGWSGDFPDLDLERYFPQSAAPLVVYGDLDELTNRFIQFRHYGSLTRIIGPGSIPRKARLAKDRAFGYVTDIGEPEAPPSSWDDLKLAIPRSDAKLIESAVSDGRFSYLVVRYARGGTGAAVVLRIWKEASGSFALRAIRSASESMPTLTMRAGPRARTLCGSSVAVIGVGAIGSFVCDLLSRSGVGHITAFDPDTVRPGNLIRHLADASSVGLAKPEAVKRIIASRAFSSTEVLSEAGGLPAPVEVMGVFAEHDLVIDASASGDVTPVLVAAATAGGHNLLSVCLQEEGSVVRVDVIPPLKGDAIEETRLGPPPSRDELRFEAGCGDPVSQTPAFAVYEAAALAARHAIGLLTGTPISDAGTVRDYR